VREARRGDPARLLRRFASRNDSPKITGHWLWVDDYGLQPVAAGG